MVAIIVINYKKPELVVNFCASATRLAGSESLRIVIVDNEATDSSRAMLGILNSVSVEVLHESKNWGYFGGARRGLEWIRAHRLAPEWVIVSNSDIEFPDSLFVEKLEKLRFDGREVGVLAPRILSQLSQTNQNPYMIDRPTPARMHFYKRVFRNRATCFAYQMLGISKRVFKGLIKRAAVEAGAQRIYAPHGAFMIFSRFYFERGGNFDHEPFLYGEEITVAENCRRLGLEVDYEPSLAVSHIEHATIGWLPSANMLKFQREASRFCADTYFR